MSQTQEYLKFLASGCIGTGIFYAIYEVVYRLGFWLPIGDFVESFAWTLSYIVSIVFQHYLHAKLVFGNWQRAIAPLFSERYWKSLFGTYLAYALSLAISPFIAHGLALSGIDYRLAFVCNLGLTGLLNYLTVRKAIQ